MEAATSKPVLTGDGTWSALNWLGGIARFERHTTERDFGAAAMASIVNRQHHDTAQWPRRTTRPR